MTMPIEETIAGWLTMGLDCATPASESLARLAPQHQRKAMYTCCRHVRIKLHSLDRRTHLCALDNASSEDPGRHRAASHVAKVKSKEQRPT